MKWLSCYANPRNHDPFGFIDFETERAGVTAPPPARPAWPQRASVTLTLASPSPYRMIVAAGTICSTTGTTGTTAR